MITDISTITVKHNVAFNCFSPKFVGLNSPRFIKWLMFENAQKITFLASGEKCPNSRNKIKQFLNLNFRTLKMYF